jgi:hypothetical protein
VREGLDAVTERKLKAFDLATDSAKQLVTLTAAILALTVGVARDIAEGDPRFLVGAWALYLVSLLAGVWRMSALTAELEREGGAGEEGAGPSTLSPRVRLPSLIQVVTFAGATTLLVGFGLSILPNLE